MSKIVQEAQTRLRELDRQQANLAKERRALKVLLYALRNTNPIGPVMSPEARKRIAQAQKKRWAAQRAAKKAA